MILEKSIKIRNYKCFASAEQGFDKIYPINIIIGKNNSGKSSLVDLINYVVNPNPNIIAVGRNGLESEIILSDTLSDQYINPVFPDNISGGGVPGSNYYAYGKTFLNSKILYSLKSNSKKEILYWEKPMTYNTEHFQQGIQNQIRTSFEGKKFKRISAERDVKAQAVDPQNLNIQEDGFGVTNVIRRIIHEVRNGTKLNNPDLIERDLLERLNQITAPDIEFIDIVVRDNGDNIWEIYFKDANTGLIALSKMGSGLKTILIVLLNLIVVPEIENISKQNLIFGFEELENNLHPSLQRRLFNYIANYAEQYKCYFFITTHSSIVIDLFGSSKISQIIHVENDGKCSTAKTIQTIFDSKSILKDLDYKASDLLLSNGIIWVEGPSDAIYLELLIDLYKQTTPEDLTRLNYTIQSLSTAIWKYAGFMDFDWEKITPSLQNKIISLEKINHNHLIIIDNDGNYEDLLPSKWEEFSNGTGKNKASLIYESIKNARNNEEDLENNFGDTKDGKLFFWINEGTFETYLKPFISTAGENFKKYFDLKETRGYFEKKRDGKDCAISKVELAAQVANFALANKLSFTDFAPSSSILSDKMNRLLKTIKSWN